MHCFSGQITMKTLLHTIASACLIGFILVVIAEASEVIKLSNLKFSI